MIIFIIDRVGKPLYLRTKVRNWRRDLKLINSLDLFVDGVGFERPFDEFKLSFVARRSEIYSLFVTLNSELRADISLGLTLSGAESKFGAVQGVLSQCGSLIDYEPCIMDSEIFSDCSYGGTA
jgi:hypothetical protein